MKKNTLTLILLVLFSSYFGQNTLYLFFDIGYSKINEEHKKTLDQLPIDFDLEKVDSIYFIGTADSIGNMKSNLRLSEKRAKNVSDYASRYLSNEIKTKVFALGEQSTKGMNNRKVEVVLFLPPIPTPEKITDIKTITIAKKQCFEVDYFLLHRCRTQNITKKKKNYVKIEVDTSTLSSPYMHYYGTLNKEGKFESKKVVWEKKETGALWWKKSRWITEIPANDYYRYKIFTIKEPPCDECAEDLFHSNNLTKADSCIQIDRFLMDNMQIKVSLNNPNVVKVRAPIELVDPNATYYLGCGLSGNIKWETKKGKKNESYYFTKLPIRDGYVTNISRKMTCCKYKMNDGSCGDGFWRPPCLDFPAYERLFTIDAGTYYQNKLLIPYIGLAFNRNGNFANTQLTLGTDKYLGFYGSVNWNKPLFSLPVQAFNPSTAWQSSKSAPFLYTYFDFYVGSELKTHLNKTNKQVDQSIHLGFSIQNYKEESIFDRIYLQGGIGTNYLNDSFQLFPIFHLGTRWNVFKN